MVTKLTLLMNLHLIRAKWIELISALGINWAVCRLEVGTILSHVSGGWCCLLEPDWGHGWSPYL